MSYDDTVKAALHGAVDVDDPVLLRERICRLEAILELLHGALHDIGAWRVFVALLCPDADPDNFPPGVLDKIEETLTAYEVGLASGTKKRTVKR